MAAVHRHNALLKASISSATNAHRLGANEAPPAIISIFTGTQIADIFERLEKSTEDELINFAGKEGLTVGVSQIPEILLDNTDRNGPPRVVGQLRLGDDCPERRRRRTAG